MLERLEPIINAIKTRTQITNTYLENGDRIDCCDEMKKMDNTRNYWRNNILYPKTPFTTWWVEQWTKILPEIGDRLEDRGDYYLLLNLNHLPIKEKWFKQHFIWTVLRAAYIYPTFQSVKLVMDKYPDLEFLPTLRFFTSVNLLNVGRFITEKGYFSLNVEKARKNFASNDCKFMWRVFSGMNNESPNFDIFKSVHGIHDRIKVTNQYYEFFDWLADLDQSGVYMFELDNKKLKLNYLSHVLQFQEIGGYSSGNVQVVQKTDLKKHKFEAVTDESFYKSYFSRL